MIRNDRFGRATTGAEQWGWSLRRDGKRGYLLKKRGDAVPTYFETLAEVEEYLDEYDKDEPSMSRADHSVMVGSKWYEIYV